MYIFNTTFVVNDNVQEQWLSWAKETHIPFMLESKLLSHAQIAKVLGTEAQDGTSYSVQFRIDTIEALEEWHVKHAGTFEKNMAEKFGSEVLFFATILEIVE